MSSNANGRVNSSRILGVGVSFEQESKLPFVGQKSSNTKPRLNSRSVLGVGVDLTQTRKEAVACLPGIL